MVKTFLFNIDESKDTKYIPNLGPDDYSEELELVENGRKDIGIAWKYREGSCYNHDLILEGSFSRLVKNMESANNAWGIISATRKELYTFEQNKARNVKLREALRSYGLGVYVLIGHWQITTSDGKLKDTVERSFFVSKPLDMTVREFEKIMKELMVIDGVSQEAVLIRYPKDNDVGHPEGPYLIKDNGTERKLEGKELNLDYISQLYSQWVHKRDIPFTVGDRDEDGNINIRKNTNGPYIKGRNFKFEGVEVPCGNTGRMFFKEAGLSYYEALPEQYVKNTMKDILP